jgi:formiminotetrahydrofolate cyclodeaminase
MPEMSLATHTYADVLAQVADSAPVPGGGSVSALNGATAAALVEMVAASSAKKKAFADKAEDLLTLVESAHSYRRDLLALADRDSAAYAGVSAAFKLPKETPEQQTDRQAAIQAALRGAADVPLETARACMAVLHLALAVAEMGNPAAITDVAVAAMTASAGVEGAMLNVRINLADITDAPYTSEMAETLRDMQGDLADGREEMNGIIAGIAPLP